MSFERVICEGELRIAYPDDAAYEPALALDGLNLAWQLKDALGLAEIDLEAGRQNGLQGAHDVSSGRRVRITVEVLT